MTEVLRVENVSKQFVVQRNLVGRPVRTVKAVDDVTLSLAEGETLALVGESGCGKSTLGRLATRLIDPSAGRIVLAGEDITETSGERLRSLRRKMQVIFQDPFGSLNPRMTAGRTLEEPLILHDVVDAPNRTERVIALLEAVGLREHHRHLHPHEFSGGQRQRLAIARALAAEPQVIVCDEPVSALDVSIRSQVLNLLVDLQAERRLSYLFISHDLGVVRHIADRVAVMYLGRIVEMGATEQIFEAPNHPYTRALMAAVPVPQPASGRTHVPIEGDLPSPLDPPSGCHFHTRCPFAGDICRTDQPALRPVAAGHVSACHFRDELPAARDLVPPPAIHDPRLEKLFGAFGDNSTGGRA